MTYPVGRAAGLPWDPFAEMRALRAQMGQMYGTRLAGDVGLEPPVDMEQDDDGWTVTARLPGVAPDEVEIEVDDRDLYIHSSAAASTGSAARDEGDTSGIDEVIEAGGTRTPADRGEERTIEEVIEPDTATRASATRASETRASEGGGEARTVIQPRPGTARDVERAFDYRIGLPGDVDAEHVDATMSHGLLTVRLPRATRRPRRRVSITR